jgi:crossover junction endodeoxyribonuclease RuvC
MSSAGNRREYNLASMRNLLTLYHIDMAFVEKVHSMPGQGVRSMFTMGVGYGAWLGLLAGLQIPTTLVMPQRWKKVMLADQGQDKDASRLRAIQLFPTEAEYFTRKKDDGRAEAALIAEYGRRNG